MKTYRQIAISILLVVYIFNIFMIGVNANVGDTTNIVATDALGRTLPVVTDYDDEKYVGVFYWLWHKGGLDSKDTTKLLRTNPTEFWDAYDDTGIAPTGGMYYFNEPLYGYYSSQDEWVMRKHIELFIYAGVDFLCLDYTNPDEVFENALFKFLDVLDSYSKAGWKTPKIVFMTNTGSDKMTRWLNMAIYRKERYKEHWFYGPYEKPLLVVGGDDLTNGLIDDDILEFFHIRPAQWPGLEYTFYEDGFPWCDLNRPQKVHQNLINVAVAQHRSYVFSFGVKKDPIIKNDQINYGRGYTTASKKNGDVEAILAGANIQEHWDYAISQNPEMIFVTGWNEWATNKRYSGVEGSNVAWFVDSFNTEYSRDMEMTKEPTYVVDEETGEYIKEGYGDNYYLQLVQNIRKYKGTMKENDIDVPVSKSIDVSSGVSQWEDVNTVYVNPSFDNIPRKKPYEMSEPDNFIKQIKVTHDAKNLYFYIETDESITKKPEKSTNHMNLFIGVNRQEAPSWENYQYVVNRLPIEGNKASFEVSTGGFNFNMTNEIDCYVDGKVMQVAVPFKDLNIKEGSFSVYFKCADSVIKEDDIMDYYVSGESVPIGRLSYVYRSDKEAWKEPSNGGLSSALKITIAIASIVVVLMIGLVIVVFVKNKKVEK